MRERHSPVRALSLPFHTPPMDLPELCGCQLPSGALCRVAKAKCRRHKDGPVPMRGPGDPPQAIVERQLQAVGWWLLDELAAGRIDPRRASVMASVMRVVATAPEDHLSEEEALRETELRGRIMYGLPPRDEEERALAESIFSAEALADIDRAHSRVLEESWSRVARGQVAR